MVFSESVGATLEMIRHGRTERVIELRGTDLHIGRHPRVGVTLDHPKVSLYHARIERRFDGSYRVVDLMSKNATLVDGVKLKPFEPACVREGTCIRIVDYDFVFHEPTARVGGPGEPSRSTVLGSLDDLSSEQLVQRSAQPAEALRAVLDVVRALGGASDLDERLARALDGLMLVFPLADRGFVATAEPDGSLPLRAFRCAKGPANPPVLSRTIVHEVLRGGKALLIKDVLFDERFKDQESVAASIRTALCAPLRGRDGQPIGMIQIDSVTLRSGFRDEDLDLLAALAVPIGAAIENDRLVMEQASWAAAREIQLALLPRSRPTIPGYTFWECYRPAQEVGGDLYDYIAVEDFEPGDSDPGRVHVTDPDRDADGVRWCVTLGDVAGHGMPAAILMARICPEARLLVRAGYAPTDVLAQVNRHYYESGLQNRFVTMVLAEIDPRAHRLKVANSGHPSPLVRRAAGRVEELECPGAGPPLGVVRDASYESAGFDLAPGDVVVLFSDGVSDAVNLRNQSFGVARLKALVGQTTGGAAEVGEAILAIVRDHMIGRSQLDDLTIVCFGRDALEPAPGA
ncbi:SpoIIE family protein phosphatase [Paludisphaera borealis]|uniref:Phosphoserine phosphatase RsbP n=1 Tax=Paludisphaera borealis TaxID=1387353 RepID=A0A1U7CT55_9BACT|nr:SpoIIE family protein phosphatase [Paludisphaera borealis]APW62079.1 Phosphoserine phosphatase RsbP [Paludisphaera borealis]